MPSLLNIGASALLANQQVLRTTGNNIANVNTQGYTRQQVQLEARQGVDYGGGYYGGGVGADQGVARLGEPGGPLQVQIVRFGETIEGQASVVSDAHCTAIAPKLPFVAKPDSAIMPIIPVAVKKTGLG